MFKPQYHKLEYQNNPKTGRFEKLPSIKTIQSMPFELKIEETQEERIRQQGANLIITGRIKNKKREFFTGLIPIQKNCFQGNNYEFLNNQKKLSLAIFIFSSDNSSMTVYYFNRYYIDNAAHREKFCQTFLSDIINKKGSND